MTVCEICRTINFLIIIMAEENSKYFIFIKTGFLTFIFYSCDITIAGTSSIHVLHTNIFSRYLFTKKRFHCKKYT